ncbi:N-6 adenine-specific DNA methylase [Acetobacter nitrogenifigens DSM 23921 = NBRC 105050]|nr:N-6 adenine-specific DNA methylase [Acetobacter nitrogenifigens DSM 23921 = NBRC 105050]
MRQRAGARRHVRIIGGDRRGRQLQAPPGSVTRPTADRVRQALFDMVLHASWGGRDAVEGVAVLDGFAGTGALGLEALSRGAASCAFFERDRAALAALRVNITACRKEDASRVFAGDILAPPKAVNPCGLVFLDPPYGKGLPALALNALTARGWIAPDALVIVETAKDEAPPVDTVEILFERVHGAARLWGWRAGGHG